MQPPPPPPALHKGTVPPHGFMYSLQKITSLHEGWYSVPGDCTTAQPAIFTGLHREHQAEPAGIGFSIHWRQEDSFHKFYERGRGGGGLAGLAEFSSGHRHVPRRACKGALRKLPVHRLSHEEQLVCFPGLWEAPNGILVKFCEGCRCYLRRGSCIFADLSEEPDAGRVCSAP